eukprot:10787862-Karenia_brevis.AAC.1
MAAYLKTLWNGWVTDAHMKGLNMSWHRKCFLGCGYGDDDVLHHARCPAFWEFVSGARPQGL